MYLGMLGGIDSRTNALNAFGHVAGYAYIASDAAYHATLWNGATATDIGTLGGTNSTAYAINISGQLGGVAYATGDADKHAMVWNGTNAIGLNSSP
jgi:probable HAF family extracellular repeat protein